MGRNTELVLEDTTADDPAIEIELDVSPRKFPTYVTGATSATTAIAFEHTPCSYCGAAGQGLPACACCGAPARSSQPPEAPLAAAPTLAPPARSDAFVDAVASVPFGFWKRLPVYAFLAMILGNGCMCGGLSGRTNIVLALLIVLGAAGAIISFQRSP